MQLFENEPDITARAVAMDGFNELAFNCYKDGPSKGHPALKDWKFRQALNWAVDLQRIVDVVWLGYTTPGTTIVPPDYYTDPDWHWEPPADVRYTYDPEKAGQMLDAAGYPDADGDGAREYKGKPIELGLIARTESPESQQTAKLIAGWFEDVGIKVQVDVMDEATLTDNHLLNYEGDVFTPDYDMFLWGWYLEFDPGSMLSYFTKSQIENWSDCAWWDPEYEDLYTKQGEELDPVKRKEYIDRMQQILYEQTPYIVTDYGPDFEAYNTGKWQGYIAIPDPKGNTLIPPFGNGGYANFMNIEPKAAVAAEEQGSSAATVWIVVVAAVVVVGVVLWLVLRARRTRATEE
jgi:peptide/nickel transport system substrate-binding protein